MNIRQSFQMALKSLKTGKMRAFLTMLGIIIGVASVIVLISLMNGLSGEMTSNFEQMGTNTITVSVFGRGGNRSFEESDVQALIEEHPDLLTGYSPVVSVQVTVKQGTESLDSSATGVNEFYAEIQKMELQSGRFIQYLDAETRQKVCVIGTYQKNELFPGSQAVGEKIRLNGATYTVVGVLEESADSTEGSGDDVLYIPWSSATRLAGSAQVGSWMLSAADTGRIDETMSAIKSALYSAFQDENAYRVMSMSSLIDQVNEMMGTVSMVLVGIAGISLVVGGIGIMNIMLVSVTERTREIGIRKALGARRKAIMSQFIIEAATTSAAGGIIGIGLGIGLAYLGGSLMGMNAAPSPGAVLPAFGVSVAIGMIFGYFPAGKAAKMNPVDALRHE